MSRTIRYLPPEARRVLILVNATAGARADRPQVDELRARLEQHGLRVETISDLAGLRDAASSATDSPLRAVVAAGGDGTVSAVVNATPPDTPITVLPLGTENLLAKFLAYPFSLADLSHTIVHGATVAIDAGRANERLFLLMVGCGFDAHVVRGLHAQRRGHIRHTTYIKPILASIRSYEYPEMRVTWEPGGGLALPGDASASQSAAAPHVGLPARWAFVVNIPRYAAGLRLMPGARCNDGLLDACLFPGGSLLHGLRYLSGILRNRHQQGTDCQRLSAERIRIESEREVPYQLDGDPGGLLPVEISVIPGRVRMLVAEAWASEHGFRHATREDAAHGGH